MSAGQAGAELAITMTDGYRTVNRNRRRRSRRPTVTKGDVYSFLFQCHEWVEVARAPRSGRTYL
jgi:hypothetical protein